MTPSLGYAIADEIDRGRGESSEEVDSVRLGVFWVIFLSVFGILFLRLTFLQIVEGQRNRILSEENRIIVRRMAAPRGVITDRRGEVIAQNVPVYKRVQRSACRDTDFGLGQCQEFVDISREEALLMESTGSSQLWVGVGRRYVLGPEIAHLVGYVGEINEEELSLYPTYKLGDTIGKSGVELVYEDRLRGRDGAELVEVDANSIPVREVSRKEPVAGSDVHLNADVRLQKKAYELLENRRGALVALEPQTGEVLTLVSRPSFDPNDVATSLNREDQPFFNRAVGGLYPPGSVFKIVTAAAGLEEGKITASTEFEDTGEIRIGSYRYGNWYFDQYGRTEGSLSIVRAIKRSNDIFFYRVGELVGATRLSQWGKALGLGQATGIDLPQEAEGLVPSPLWKEKMRGERWFLGNTFHFAIGQADLQVTPIQIARMTAAVVNGGKLCRPRVVAGEEASCEEIGIHEETLSLIRQGMVEACLPGGTAFPFFNFGAVKDGELRRIEVGCKTGTAEYGDPQGRTHAWFTVFAPAQDPEIVVTVLLEGAGEGSYQAAPVAKGFLEYYFGEVAE